jgi:hypothetical protein
VPFVSCSRGTCQRRRRYHPPTSSCPSLQDRFQAMSSDLPLVLLSWPLEGREHLLTDPAVRSLRSTCLDMFGKGLGRYECKGESPLVFSTHGRITTSAHITIPRILISSAGASPFFATGCVSNSDNTWRLSSSTSLPKTVCLPSRCGVGRKVKKN